MVGTQEHSFTTGEFIARFDQSYPDFAGAIRHDQLTQQFASLTSGAPL
jgi:hypothetical protein